MAKHSKNNKPKHAGTGSKAHGSLEREQASGDLPSDARSEDSASGKAVDEAVSEDSDTAFESAASNEDNAISQAPSSEGDDAVPESSDPEDAAAKAGDQKGEPADAAEDSKAEGEAPKDLKEQDPGKPKSEDSASKESKEKDSKGKKAQGAKHAAPADASSDEKKKKSKKKSKGKHSAASKDKREQPVIQSVPMPGISAKEEEEKARKRRKRFKIAGITVGAAAAVCVIAYLGGALFFATHYLPNTTVADIDISLKSPEEMQTLLDDSIDEFSMKVVGNGLDFTVTSDEAEISADSSAAADAVLKSNNFWAWPVLVFEDHDLTSSLSDAISADKLAEVVKEEVDKVNDDPKSTLPVDAHVAYNEKNHRFEVVEETMGTKLDQETVMNQIVTGVLNLEPKVNITSDALIQPKVFSNDERLTMSSETANEMIKANVEVKMEGYVVTKVNPDVSSKWVTFTPEPELKAVFSDEALSSWANDVANMCNTVGSERTYTRPDGKQITVSGGVYGWEVDNNGLAEKIIEAVRSGKNTTIDIPVIQSGTGYNGLGGQDWGKRYVDVDLGEQYARFYGDDGSIIWEAPIVSGKPGNGHGTPQGVWCVNRKASPSKLIGEMRNGKPEYETTVKYWMPFQGNAIGFHDATWQPYFGGSLYLSNGSHGCINLSYGAAQSLYGILNEGDVVVVHY